MVNSESTPSEKELLPEELQKIVAYEATTGLQTLEDDVPEGYRFADNLKTVEWFEDFLVRFWHTMHKAFEALPDPSHEIPASNGPTLDTPREDLIDFAVLSILENVEDLWPSDKDTLKKELRDELMDLLERVVERMT